MYIGSMDVGGSKTLVGIINERGEVLSKVRVSTNVADCLGHFSVCCQKLRECAETIRLPLNQLNGIGIALPGIVNKSAGILTRAVFAGWCNITVADIIRREMKTDAVFIENDVNACAIGELCFGFKERFHDFIWVTVSTGVGGAVVCGDRLIPGALGCAGEMGHVKVEYTDPYICPCKQYGCLEAHGSGTAITRYTKQAMKEDSGFAALFKAQDLSADALGCSVLAEQGNETALGIYRKAAVYLGRGLSYGVNILNPEAIILGGGISRSLNLLHDTIQETIRKCVINNLAHVEVVQTQLGYDAAFLGAAALALYQG
ncbi:MAG: ROK family protein [Treponema sp.]|jgi:glucokinase|nr:ROK family protein [Treponema sp.]